LNFGKLIGFVALVFSLLIIWQMRQLLLLLFTAVVLGIALNILVKRLQTRGIKRSHAVSLSVVSLLILLGSSFLLILPSLAVQFEELVELVPKGIDLLLLSLKVFKNYLSPELVESLPNIEELLKQLQPVINSLLGSGLSFFYVSLGSIFSLLLLFVLTLMLLGDPLPYSQGFIRLFPAFYRRRAKEILRMCEESLEGWLISIFFNMIILGVMSFFGLLILGVPLAFAQAVLTGIFNFIPNIGPILSLVSPMAIALLQEPWKPLAVLFLYIIIQQLEGHFLTPLAMSNQTTLLPPFTLIAQVFFASFFGFLGLFLAIPLTIVGTIWVREILIKDILDQWEIPTKDYQS
jgi:predicted PurR-regulated permease PerM